MAEIIKIFKKLIPPIFLDLVSLGISKKVQSQDLLWEGPFSIWEEVSLKSTGYDKFEILEQCKNSLLKVKNKEAAYERDSVLFDQIQYSWPLLAALQKAAIEKNGNLHVLDFGGSLGSSYYQNRSFLGPLKELSWSIVEQDHFVICGKENFQNSELRFYHTIDQCLEEKGVDILLLSSVLQYLDHPFEFFETLMNYKFKYIVIDRTTFIKGSESKVMLQSVSENIYEASYPCWFLSEDKLTSIFEKNYIRVAEFDSFCDGPPQEINGLNVTWKGLLLESKR